MSPIDTQAAPQSFRRVQTRPEVAEDKRTSDSEEEVTGHRASGAGTESEFGDFLRESSASSDRVQLLLKRRQQLQRLQKRYASNRQ